MRERCRGQAIGSPSSNNRVEVDGQTPDGEPMPLAIIWSRAFSLILPNRF